MFIFAGGKLDVRAPIRVDGGSLSVSRAQSSSGSAIPLLSHVINNGGTVRLTGEHNLGRTIVPRGTPTADDAIDLRHVSRVELDGLLMNGAVLAPRDWTTGSNASLSDVYFDGAIDGDVLKVWGAVTLAEDAELKVTTLLAGRAGRAGF